MAIVILILAGACTQPASRASSPEETNEFRKAVISADSILIGTVGKRYLMGNGMGAIGFQTHEVLKGSALARIGVTIASTSNCLIDFKTNVEYLILTRVSNNVHDASEFCLHISEATDNRVATVRLWIAE